MNFEEEEKTELNSVLLHFSIAVQSASDCSLTQLFEGYLVVLTNVYH